MENEVVSKNFIEQEIEKDLREGVYDTVCTRFPPEPNGCLLYTSPIGPMILPSYYRMW